MSGAILETVNYRVHSPRTRLFRAWPTGPPGLVATVNF